MTLVEMYKEIPEFRARFLTALNGPNEEVRLVIGDVVKKTSSEMEERIIVENLKEVYEEWLEERLLEEKKGA